MLSARITANVSTRSGFAGNEKASPFTKEVGIQITLGAVPSARCHPSWILSSNLATDRQ